MALRSYNPKNVSLICAGAIIGGFADGTFISVDRNEDFQTFQVGGQGDGTRVLSSDRSGRLTITLQQTSPSNGVLDAQRIAAELSGGGLFSMFLRDNDSLDTAAAVAMYVVKAPTMEFGNELANREWVLETDNLILAVLGQSA